MQTSTKVTKTATTKRLNTSRAGGLYTTAKDSKSFGHRQKRNNKQVYQVKSFNEAQQEF